MPAYCVTPTGELVIYQNAGFCVRGETMFELYTGKDKTSWVADVPKTWAVGWQRPAIAGRSDALKDIKRALQNFDARTGRWKD
jgi:hypothetical protein